MLIDQLAFTIRWKIGLFIVLYVARLIAISAAKVAMRSRGRDLGRPLSVQCGTGC